MPSEQRKRLSVIIVSYENLEVLRACLGSIEKFNDIGDELEVVVVEQSSTDAVYEAVRAEYPWVVAVRNENRGFGAGNNAGARVATGELLLFLNPDTCLVEPVFGFALARFEENPKLGLFGLRLIDACGGRNRSFHFRKPYGLLRALVWRLCDRFDVFVPRSMYIAGADMFVPAAAFHNVGGFNEGMFMYFEETYLCERLDELGLCIAYFPQKRIVHLEGRSSCGTNVLARQLDSLQVLCSSTRLDYGRILLGMRRDRAIKALFPGRGDLCREEMAQIDVEVVRGVCR